MSVDFRPIIPDPAPTPNRGNYTDLQPFRFWCQKVLPLVYDESLSYYELLCKVVDYLNKTMEDVGVLNDDIGTLYDAFTSLTGWTEDQVEALLTAYSELQDYVNNYFDNLNVQTEINNKLDAMAEAGTLTALLSPFVPDAVAAWLASHVDPSTGYVVDKSLSVEGAAADAKAAGDAIRTNKSKINEMICSIGGNIKFIPINTATMYDGSGNVISSGYNDLVFYQINDLEGISKILFHFIGSFETTTHYINQFAADGTLLDYDTIEHDIHQDYLAILKSNCSMIKISAFDTITAFSAVTDIENVRTIAEESSTLSKKLDIQINGGSQVFDKTLVETMIGSDGTEKTATAGISFYLVEDLEDIHSLTFTFERSNSTSNVHWFNQIDTNGNVMSYVPFEGTGQTPDVISVSLLTGCVAIKVSSFNETESWSGNGKLTISHYFESEFDNIFFQLDGGLRYFTLEATNTIIGTDGNPRTAGNGILFDYITDVNGAPDLTFTFEQSNSASNVHWFNQFNAEGNLLSYAPFETAGAAAPDIAVVPLLPNCKAVKFSYFVEREGYWSGNGKVDVSHNFIPEVVKRSNISDIKYISGLGDSITYGYSTAGQVEKTYQKRIADALGAYYQNLGVISTPVCPNSDYTGGQNDDAFVYRFDDISDDADLIIIAGGTNDFRHNVPLGTEADTASSYETTFYGACDYLISEIIKAHPEARLVWITPFHQTGDNAANTEGHTLQDYITAIKKKCEKYGTACVDGYAYSGINLISEFCAEMMPDSLHPNAKGHELIFKNLMPFFAMV